MKKLLVVLLFALAFVLCFVSCGDKDSSGTPEQGTPEQEPPHVCAPAAAVIENKVEATCETAGSCDEVIYCADCDKELSRESKTIAALGHKCIRSCQVARANGL